MTSTNRVRVTAIRESQIGVTPGSPRMRTLSVNSVNAKFVPEYTDDPAIRGDRMNLANEKVFENTDVDLVMALRYPVPLSPEAQIWASAFFNDWVDTPSRDNDGTADSVITDINATGGVVTVTTGAAFASRQLVRFSGFTAAANNGTFLCTTGSATVPAFASAGLVTEAAPPANARMKAVGFQGTSGDITATATGLASTTLNFTTLGLAVGQWIKIGGSALATQFATTALNGFARITAIAANALTLDNRPTGWTTDTGTSKTITVWFGDTIKNGLSMISQTLEVGFMGQTTPSYVGFLGQVVGTLSVEMTSKSGTIPVSVAMMGLSATRGTTSLDSVPDAAITNSSVTTNANVARISEGGVVLGAPNCARTLSISINNNVRARDCLQSASPVSLVEGEATVTGQYNGYFGDLTLYEKFLSGATTSISSVHVKNSQAIVFEVPAAKYTGGGSLDVGGKNADVVLPLDFTAFIDTLTNSHIQMNRFEYLEV